MPRLDYQSVIRDLDELASQSGGRFAGAKRLAWTPDWLAARAWLTGKLTELGLEPKHDPAGNLWAAIEGEREQFLIVGSHIDAVPDGGWLDGVLGAMTALETVRKLANADVRPPVGVRFVDWADEEGARFGRSLLGSSACAGNLDPDEVRHLRDASGIGLADALASCGVDLDAAAATAREALRGAIAYLELHIEQGPVLMESDRLAGAVSGTVGVERHLINFSGQAAHAGSTPMRLRRDSLAAAARAVGEVRQSAIAHGGVATSGRLSSTPGLITAVAGETEMQLDQRHPDADKLGAMWSDAERCCRAAAEALGCTVSFQDIFHATPTTFDSRLVELARRSVAEAGGGDGPAIASGALHDATEIGRLVPTVMIFARSEPPVSHTHIEDSPERALAVAIDAFGRTVGGVLERCDEFATGAGFQP